MWNCKVVLPSTPADAKELLQAAVRDHSPVVCFEDKMMCKLKDPTSDSDFVIALGGANVKCEGDDIILVATSSIVQVALGAAALLEEARISAEVVVDPRTTWPLDEKTLIESAKTTSHIIVPDDGYKRYGVTAKIASQSVSEGARMLCGKA